MQHHLPDNMLTRRRWCVCFAVVAKVASAKSSSDAKTSAVMLSFKAASTTLRSPLQHPAANSRARPFVSTAASTISRSLLHASDACSSA
eukprot:2198537-Amphidinium_carterae.1